MFFRFVRLPTGFFLALATIPAIIAQEIIEMKIEPNQRLDAGSRVHDAGEVDVMRKGHKQKLAN